MSFRARLLVAFLAAVLLPMIVLALFIRDEMTGRLTAQYERRVESLIAVIEGDLAEEREKIATSIGIIRNALVEDNQFRRAAVDHAGEERRYLLDYAAGAMKLTGLSMLQIQDDAGRIISSGHFRNEFDRMEPQLPRLLASTWQGMALVQARAPDTRFLALAGVDSLRLGNGRFTIVGGMKVEQRFLAGLAREDEMTVALIYPAGVLSSSDYDSTTGGTGTIERKLSVPFIDSDHGELTLAEFRVSHDLAELQALQRSIDRWFLIAVVAAGLLSIVLVSWLASRISQPLVELADKTSRIDLDRLDIDFDTGRKDEIGVLSRLLGAMTDRLRASAGLIKDAERRATLGELARQVNHDIKNGLTPIRNVFRHLSQLSEDDPGQLANVLGERRSTLDSSISYLENLASNYARLSPRSERRACSVNDIVRGVVTHLQGVDGVDLQVDLEDGAVVLGDPVALRRVLENLVNNAMDSLDSKPGRVTIATAVDSGGDGPRVRITVADTGTGMSAEHRARVFDDFFTTKENGTGLGLSIVRRLVMDLDGSIQVESEEGIGSRFVIDLPGTGTA